MRISNAEHESHPWVISEIAPDFKLLDVWELPVEGTHDEFSVFLEGLSTYDVANSGSRMSDLLFWVRFRLGELFGWDDGEPRPIPGCAETSLGERLPQGLRGSTTITFSDALQRAAGGFSPLYETDNEWAAEISNATVHGVAHLSWVDVGAERYRARMAVYVKTRGRLGDLYMLMIQPFRHLIVYPALMRSVGRMWEQSRASTQTTA